MIVIDKLCYSSRLRYVNPMEKFVFSMATLLLCVISRSILVSMIVLLTNGILTVKKGGIPLFHYGKLMTVPLVFLILSTLTIIVNVARKPLDAYAIRVGEWYITGSRSSLLFGVQLILTALAAVSCLYFLSLNTTMTDILGILTRLHCPAILVELMMLIYRFIFVLMDVASNITVSQQSRLGNKDFKTSLSSFGKMAAVLFVRAMKRSGALYDAMESRGYDGRIRVLQEFHPAKVKEIAAICIYEVFLAGIAIGRAWLWR